MARQPVPIETTSTWEDHSIATSGQSTLVVVSLPTQTEPGYEQKVVGQVSPYASDVEEFKGIPYGRVSRRWEHSTVRTKLPSDVFDATKHGYFSHRWHPLYMLTFNLVHVVHNPQRRTPPSLSSHTWSSLKM